MKAKYYQGLGALVLLLGCAPAVQRPVAVQRATRAYGCDSEAFTDAPSEHMLVELDTPFYVKAVEGVISSEGGEWPDGISVLVEIRPARGRGPTQQTDSNPDGSFRIPNVAPGEYCFKATAQGWQSVMGVIIVSRAAGASNRIRFAMPLGL
jgi:hypothetical protein